MHGVAELMSQYYDAFHCKYLSKEEVYILGLNHDIGYEFSKFGLSHNKIGGDILKRNGYIYWKEVYYHDEVQDEYKSLFLDILNSADMQIDKYGNDVGYAKRLEDIENRYGRDSNVYKKCVFLVNELKDRY
jgi:hypothetical protein